MSKKTTYINLINDFWERYAQEPISTPAALVYLYLLNLLNRRFWEPVFISDHDLAKGAGVSRRNIKIYKAEIAAAELLKISPQGVGRSAGTCYELTAQKCTINGAKMHQLDTQNGAKKSQLKKETAQKCTINGAKMHQLDTPTPIYNNIKTIKTDDNNNKTHARTRAAVVEPSGDDFIEVVEPEEVKPAASFLISQEDKKKIAAKLTADRDKTPAEIMEAARKKAGEQGAQILEAFLKDDWAQERAAMSLHVSREQLEPLAREVIDQWIGEGTYHDDYKGEFDIKAANVHFINTMRRKIYDQASRPKSRDQKRQELMAASVANLNRAIRGEGQQRPQTEDPF